MNFNSTLIVAYRQFLSWRTNWRTFVLMRLVEPTIFFYGIGLGIGRFVPTMGGHDYFSFLLPGSVCLAAMFAGLIEGTFNAYTRAYMQRNWYAYLATPTGMWNILFGEIGWCAVRTLGSSILLLAVGWMVGARFEILGTLAALPFVVLTVVSIAALGYLCMSYAKSMNDFDYIWAFLITPMMVFSGVMFDITTFPPAVQVIGWLLPLTHALQIVRPLMLGEAEWFSIVTHGGVLVALTVTCLWLAHRRLVRTILA